MTAVPHSLTSALNLCTEFGVTPPAGLIAARDKIREVDAARREVAAEIASHEQPNIETLRDVARSAKALVEARARAEILGNVGKRVVAAAGRAIAEVDEEIADAVLRSPKVRDAVEEIALLAPLTPHAARMDADYDSSGEGAINVLRIRAASDKLARVIARLDGIVGLGFLGVDMGFGYDPTDLDRLTGLFYSAVDYEKADVAQVDKALLGHAPGAVAAWQTRLGLAGPIFEPTGGKRVAASSLVRLHGVTIKPADGLADLRARARAHSRALARANAPRPLGYGVVAVEWEGATGVVL